MRKGWKEEVIITNKVLSQDLCRETDEKQTVKIGEKTGTWEALIDY
jgi:hypothetical protein